MKFVSPRPPQLQASAGHDTMGSRPRLQVDADVINDSACEGRSTSRAQSTALSIFRERKKFGSTAKGLMVKPPCWH